MHSTSICNPVSCSQLARVSSGAQLNNIATLQTTANLPQNDQYSNHIHEQQQHQCSNYCSHNIHKLRQKNKTVSLISCIIYHFPVYYGLTFLPFFSILQICYIPIKCNILSVLAHLIPMQSSQGKQDKVKKKGSHKGYSFSVTQKDTEVESQTSFPNSSSSVFWESYISHGTNFSERHHQVSTKQLKENLYLPFVICYLPS